MLTVQEQPPDPEPLIDPADRPPSDLFDLDQASAFMVVGKIEAEWYATGRLMMDAYGHAARAIGLDVGELLLMLRVRLGTYRGVLDQVALRAFMDAPEPTPHPRPRCTGTTRRGTRCRARPAVGNSRCRWHIEA